MAEGDFDIDSLAVYLHLRPIQVKRLVERGKLPGRKVANQWRFSRAEIHHWLEKRMGAADESELTQMEGMLKQSAGPAAPSAVSIAEMLPAVAIAAPLAAKTRDSAIRSMVELAAKTGRLWDPAKMADAVRVREEFHSTALDNGVALLHPRRPMRGILERAFMALGCISSGVPFGASSGVLTDIFFLICSTDDAGHLRTLARLSRLLNDSAFLEGIRTAGDAEEVHALVAGFEARLSN